MKKLFFIAVVASLTFAVGCEREIIPNKIYDKPSVDLHEDTMTVSAAGGDLIIPVTSTGVDNVTIALSSGDSWIIDENGDMTPADSWVKLVKVINKYDDPTRALITWDSGISLFVEPNNTGYERSATIMVYSFQAMDTITLTQSAE
ncbi:MAG: BACON domain-containing protein [Alistipes sp.]|nr:BACON domain-containing protein [Alistipes sp.]